MEARMKKILKPCPNCGKDRLFKVGKKVGKPHKGGKDKHHNRSIADFDECMVCGWGNTKKYPKLHKRKVFVSLKR